MIDYYFFHTTEFFVIATVIAALVVGVLALPKDARGEARQYFAVAEVDRHIASPSAADSEPSIEMTCRDDGAVEFVRRGLQGVRESGMVNLAITITGLDVAINERLVEGDELDPSALTAHGVLDMFGRERYHIKYTSEATGLFAAFTLNNRPGFHTLRQLTR